MEIGRIGRKEWLYGVLDDSVSVIAMSCRPRPLAPPPPDKQGFDLVNLDTKPAARDASHRPIEGKLWVNGRSIWAKFFGGNLTSSLPL